MDTDLQDPPELIPTLVAHWREGADVVYTVRTARQGESPWKMRVTRAAYRAIQLASEIEMPVEAGDFKLLSRRVVDHLLTLDEKDLYVRGLVAWVGFTAGGGSVRAPGARRGRHAFPAVAIVGAGVVVRGGRHFVLPRATDRLPAARSGGRGTRGARARAAVAEERRRDAGIGDRVARRVRHAARGARSRSASAWSASISRASTARCSDARATSWRAPSASTRLDGPRRSLRSLSGKRKERFRSC